MNLHWIDWTIMVVMLGAIIVLAVTTKRYTQSVADFLAANRCAGRYLLCVAGGIAGLGAVTVIALFEMYYRAGFTAAWWGMMMIPIQLLLALSGFVIYRFRETRALTMAQFFEVRYSKRFRIFAGILMWVSGVINFGIFPSVGARFFIYFCGLPDTTLVFALVMLILIGVSLFFVFLGGQIAVMVTDFFQGMFTNVILLIIMVVIFCMFDWGTLVATLKTAPADASMLNPFHTSKVDSFTVFYFLVGALGAVYFCRAWQGSQGYNCSAKSAHEAKMAGILGEWRGLVLYLLLMLLPVGAWCVMHSPQFADVAAKANSVLDTVENAKIRSQITVPVVMVRMLPTGIAGLFAAVMLCAFITTHDTYLHSWGSIFIQDVILPFRKKPFDPKVHLWLLRGSILFVAVFIFFFSLLWKQNDYILMFFAMTGAIYLGGAGSVIIGGLYWKRGSAGGAWAAMIIGSTIAGIGMTLRILWPGTIYPWMEANAPWMIASLKYVIEGIANRVPGINWKVCREHFPFHGQWINFFAMLSAITGYVACSLYAWLVLKRPAFDMDRMLHRGQYAIQGDHAKGIETPPVGLKAVLPSEEYSRTDRWIYYGKFGWTMAWFAIFAVGTIINLTWGMSNDGWATFWWWKIVVTVIIGVGTTIWFLAGGIHDMIDLYKTLRTVKRDHLDSGMVVGHHNLGEEPGGEE
ncbi:MAG: sodium:solute symporter [Planctomycetes bacterium]|nr:sodium:solute symporter [Planctomycetota bacterium]